VNKVPFLIYNGGSRAIMADECGRAALRVIEIAICRRKRSHGALCVDAS
jgi:hypothetical protein